MKKALIVRHLSFENLGVLETLLTERGFLIQVIDATSAALDSMDPISPDLMVVLGGPIGAYDEKKYPFIEVEIALISQRLKSNKKILGICLGAQLIARVMGGNVYPMEGQEIGFSALQLNEDIDYPILKTLTGDVQVLHWHGDTFDLPKGAKLLASSKHCKNQAFAVGNHVLALQFHLEIDTDYIEQWLVGHAAELNAASIDPRSLRQQASLHGSALKEIAPKVISSWLDLPCS